MKYLIFIFVILFFTSCSSKSNINETANSFSLNKNVAVANVPSRVKSPISIGIGVGNYISRHVGIHVGTVFTPELSNDEALKLESAIYSNNISLSDIISSEFDRQMSNDSFYKDKYVAFGAPYSIHLFVQKYYLDTATFSSKASPKIVIDVKIFNNNGDIVYNDVEENDTLSRYYIYDESEIMASREVLQKVLRESVANCIAKIILNMKKD